MNEELVNWIAHAPEAERVREALRGPFADLNAKLRAWKRVLRRLGHRHIMTRKIRKAYGL